MKYYIVECKLADGYFYEYTGCRFTNLKEAEAEMKDAKDEGLEARIKEGEM